MPAGNGMIGLENTRGICATNIIRDELISQDLAHLEFCEQVSAVPAIDPSTDIPRQPQKHPVYLALGQALGAGEAGHVPPAAHQGLAPAGQVVIRPAVRPAVGMRQVQAVERLVDEGARLVAARA